MTREHNHYFKSVEGLDYIDVYRLLALFNVTDPCIQHAVKKLLVAGGRGAGKDITRDIKEAIDTLTRWQEMRAEEIVALQRMVHAADVQEAAQAAPQPLPATTPASIPIQALAGDGRAREGHCSRWWQRCRSNS